jgi:thiamine biosynthesis protein ThiS
MDFLINGRSREFSQLGDDSRLEDLIAALDLKADRIAVEHNGSIVQRGDWPKTHLASGDKFEIVHFVGGGSGPHGRAQPKRKNPCIFLG